jgi:hypothetical protein
MSLIDADKDGLDRSSPQPNHSDRLNDGSIKAHQTVSSTYKTDASAANVRMAMKNSMLLWYDDHNRVSSVYGYIPGYDSTVPVLIIAKYGYDVFVDILGISAP